jgi:hypothetical protein
MPTKRDTRVADLTTRVLVEIRDEVKSLRNEVKNTNARIDTTNDRLDALTTEVRQGFDHLGRRIDNVLVGEHRHEHEDLRGRVERIEEHLGLRPE